jgi:hypothetical protein
MLGNPFVHATVTTPRLSRNPKEREADEGAQDECPSGQLEHNKKVGVVLPYDARNLLNLVMVAVSVGPTHPLPDAQLDSE